MTRILIVDDHLIFAQSLAHLLRDEGDFEVVAIAQDEEEAKQMLEDKEIDLALVDIRMSAGETEGLELAEYIRKNFRHIKVIILSMHKHGAYIHRMFNTGIAGYLLKNAPAAEVIKAIRQVIGGKRYYPMDIRDAMDDFILNSEEPVKKDFHLTPTEQYILELIAEGLTSGEISKKMGNKESTVEVHRRNILSKFGVSKVAKLVKEAIRRGFLSVEE